MKEAQNESRKQAGTSGESQEEARSQTQSSKVRIEKRPLDKLIGDKRPKQRAKVSIPTELSSTAKEQEDAEEMKEEEQQP